MQVCDHDSETIIMISDRRSDACQQFLDMWHFSDFTRRIRPTHRSGCVDSSFIFL